MTHGVFIKSDRLELTDQAKIISNNSPQDSAWPMFMHDVRHTGRSPFSTENTTDMTKWELKRWGGFDSSPIIDENGTIYISNVYDPIYAIYPNGTEKWKFETDGLVESSPAIAKDGTVYVGSYDAGLYAINPNGTRKWRFGAGKGIHSSPAIAEDGTIYFGVMGPGNDKGRVFAINPNGTEKWRFDTGFWIYSSPAIGEDGTVYIGSHDNFLYALNPENGTMKWRRNIGGWCGSPSIGDDGTIYVASQSGHLRAIYPNNGTVKWKHGIDWGSSHAPAIAEDGTIYIGQKHFYAINPNGTRKWTLVLGDPYTYEVKSSCAISADGTIYFGVTLGGTSAGFIYAVDSEGNILWRKNIANNWVHSSPSIGPDGTVYIGSSSMSDEGFYGVLYAFGELDPNAPEAPIIEGPKNGSIDTMYSFNFTTTDPNGDDVYYYIDWGGGKDTEWIGPYKSGKKICLNRTWRNQGTYIIKARAKDPDNFWGSWGEHVVTIPKNKQASNTFFQHFLKRFPNAFQILRYLLGLYN
jgi:outer membrane protein assembly factor BamB